jgi:predicted nicotinamide N-methyase
MDAADFVRTQTALQTVPLVPEIRVHTASEVSPIWNEVPSLPYWCAPWPGGQALARWLLDHPEEVRGKRVMDFGTGSGIVAIAAMKAGAASVVAVDVDRFATTACEINAAANGVSVRTSTRDLVGTAQPDIDVMVAGDVWYEEEPARRFDAWFRKLEIRVLTGDPGRLYVPTDLTELARFDVPVSLDLENAPIKQTRVWVYPSELTFTG